MSPSETSGEFWLYVSYRIMAKISLHTAQWGEGLLYLGHDNRKTFLFDTLFLFFSLLHHFVFNTMASVMGLLMLALMPSLLCQSMTSEVSPPESLLHSNTLPRSLVCITPDLHRSVMRAYVFYARLFKSVN